MPNLSFYDIIMSEVISLAKTIFYSWQNDLPAKTHRYFLDKCIRAAIKSLKREVSIYTEYDRDTLGLMGSPDITDSIFKKIEKSGLFICDVSIINSETNNKKTPNPNVLIELGYAASKLGWEQIICFFDINSGKIEELPFDLRQKRITPFNPDAPDERKRVTEILFNNIKNLYSQGKLFNPLNDYMKGKIDKAFLDIGKRISNLMFGTYSLTEGLSQIPELLALSDNIILDRMCMCEFPAFIVLNTYETTEQELRNTLKDIFSSAYFPKEWAYCVLELLDWIRQYNYLISARNPHHPFAHNLSRTFDNLAVVSAQSINQSNPPNTKVVLKSTEHDGKRYIDSIKGQIINSTDFPSSRPGDLSQCYVVCENSYTIMASQIQSFISLCRRWLDITDSEFVLNPDYYYLA